MTCTSWVVTARPVALAGIAALMVAACSRPGQMAQASSGMEATREQPTAWRSLFDGRSLAAWRGYQLSEVPVAWKIADGTFYKDVETKDIIMLSASDWTYTPVTFSVAAQGKPLHEGANQYR